MVSFRNKIVLLVGITGLSVIINSSVYAAQAPASSASSSGAVCGICLEALADGEVVELDCGHKWHRACIDAWRGVGGGLAHTQCPLCRRPMNECRLLLRLEDLCSSWRANLQSQLRRIDLARFMRAMREVGALLRMIDPARPLQLMRGFMDAGRTLGDDPSAELLSLRIATALREHPDERAQERIVALIRARFSAARDEAGVQRRHFIADWSMRLICITVFVVITYAVMGKMFASSSSPV